MKALAAVAILAVACTAVGQEHKPAPTFEKPKHEGFWVTVQWEPEDCNLWSDGKREQVRCEFHVAVYGTKTDVTCVPTPDQKNALTCTWDKPKGGQQ